MHSRGSAVRDVTDEPGPYAIAVRGRSHGVHVSDEGSGRRGSSGNGCP